MGSLDDDDDDENEEEEEYDNDDDELISGSIDRWVSCSGPSLRMGSRSQSSWKDSRQGNSTKSNNKL